MAAARSRDRPTDRPTDGLVSRRLEATRRRPARLILNIDHVYSTQRDSLVITISTTGQHGPLASSIVLDRPGPDCHGPFPSRPSDWSLASWSAHIVSAALAGSFVISSNGFRSFVRRRRRVEFDESLKLTDAPPQPRRSLPVCTYARPTTCHCFAHSAIQPCCYIRTYQTPTQQRTRQRISAKRRASRH